MKNPILLKLLPHLTAVILFLILCFAYFSPMLEGKQLRQGDIIQFRGMSKEINDYRDAEHEEPLWTNGMFGGMPAYLISVRYPSNLLKHIDRIVSLKLNIPAKHLFLTLFGFYLLLVVGFRVDPWLSIAGAIAFGFSSYFFIIGVAGHNSKAHAIAYMAPVMLGIILSSRGKYLWGGVITGLFLGLQIAAGHPQITYYTLLMVLVFGIFWLIEVIKKKNYGIFLKSLGVLFVSVFLAVGANITNLWLTYEYGKVSIRGPSELTSESENRTSGLDKDYILNDYSYGITETFNLLIPNFKGGASTGFDLKSKTYQEFRRNNIPNARQMVEGLPLAYWGNQRSTSGPVYIGAAIIFFFVLGLFQVKGLQKWWLFAVVIVSIVLAWGKNFMPVSEFFINYVPGYNKFRTVSMILVLAEFAIPLLGILMLAQLIQEKINKKDWIKSLKWSLYFVGGICLFFTLFPGWLFNFSTPFDEQLLSAGWPSQFIDAIHEDRQHLLRMDAFRSLAMVLLAAGLIVGFLYGKIKQHVLIIGIAFLFLIDMWPVNKRYINNDDFIAKREVQEPFQPTSADLSILQDTDPHYRVFNLTQDPFNEARTSYFHKSIGGYHGAKLRRYQELIEHHISQNNMDVLNMLNTKYFIVPGNDNQPVAQRNQGALGNAWFVTSVKWVQNADEEIEALNDFNPAEEAIIDTRFENNVTELSPMIDSISSIELVSYKPNELIYESQSDQPHLAVFSEIYYDRGWNAFLDGEPAPYIRVNYVLRGMMVPAGQHDIRFEFHPKAYFMGEKISFISSLLLIILFVAMAIFELKKSGIIKPSTAGS